MKKQQSLSLKPVVLKQKMPKKSPIPSHRNANIIQNTSLDNLCKTERDFCNPKLPGVSIVSPKVLPEEEDRMEVLIKATDRAIEAINNGNNQFALVTLQGVENDLEQEAAEGKILDRNLIITCLYNLACVYQAMWALDDCLKYIDAVIYNLNESLIDELPKSPKRAKPSPSENITLEDTANIASKLPKKNLLLKVYLQQSAILSHLEKHTEAYSRIKSAQNLMETIIQDLFSTSMSIKASDSSLNKSFNKESVNYSYTSPISGLTSSRAREAYSFFKDEISYAKSLIEYADPFLKDFIKMLKIFTEVSMSEILKRAQKSLNNWKINIEGKQKSARKGLSKKGPLFSNEVKLDSRSLLGVQHKPDWLENFNIDSIIQMTPLRYREYAHKKDIANYLSQDSLQEKALYQSVIFFMIGTEMRFLESTGFEEKNIRTEIKKDLDPTYGITSAEAYYLKAIDTVCHYITGPCAYIDHLTARYLKHYDRDLNKKPTDISIMQDQDIYSKIEPDQPLELNKVCRSPKLRLALSSKPSDYPQTTINNDNSPKHSNDPMIVDCTSSTTSVLDKVSQKIIVEGKDQKQTLALHLRKLENELTSGNKIPVIKLSPKVGDIDIEDSQAPSADRSQIIPRNKNQSPKANPASPLSQASTSMSPTRLRKEDKKGEEEEYLAESVIHFDVTKNMPVPVPGLKLHKLDRETKNKQSANSLILKAPTSRENGYTSQRSKPNSSISARAKSSEFQSWIAKVPGFKPDKNGLRTDKTRFDMYKELKRVTNPPGIREPSAKRKREVTMSDVDRENLKTSRMAASFSREHAFSSKKDTSDHIKSRCFPTPSKYIKPREKTSQGKPTCQTHNKIQENRKNKSEVKYRKQGKPTENIGAASPDSVEEFNNSNM